ncbi:hypothetical protein SAMN05216313_11418 [Enterocloster lavalensis]|uniref:Uncharacterized protein n=1 Tax=Enterocloster lavalensis TaxID=460384 RepID=A0A1I0H3D4_9FIRM|nr:hypothetical protein SAMN05216313_11418 [Enterocloster lavalensis]
MATGTSPPGMREGYMGDPNNAAIYTLNLYATMLQRLSLC